MAKTSGLTAIDALADDDFLAVVDKSDTTMAGTGTNKSATLAQVKAYAAAGGGGSVSDPGVAYVRSDGNDTTGDGTPGAPWATAQKAFDEGATRIDLGVGSFGGIDGGGEEMDLEIRGRGASSALGDVTNDATDVTLRLTGVAVGSIDTSTQEEGSAGGMVSITGDALSSVVAVTASGGPGDVEETIIPGDGGEIHVYGPVQVLSLNSNGGINAAGEGMAGNLTLEFCKVGPLLLAFGEVAVNFAVIDGVSYVDTYP